MAKDSIEFRLRITGARETLAALRQLPKDASVELKEASQRIAKGLEGKLRAAATAEGRQAAALATTVKARRDRLPVVQAGGTRKVGRRKVPAFNLLFGSEFGMNRRSGWYAAEKYARSDGRQYKPHRGSSSYWFFTTADENQSEMVTEWRKAADDVIAKFGDGV